MSNTDFKEAYEDHVSRLSRKLKGDAALEAAVGGNFLAVGLLEHYLLRSLGLRDGHVVVDVGCGSGRLAAQLAAFPGIRYIGTDVVPRLLTYARNLCGRPDWQFLETSGVNIPAGAGIADFVCFFSVFTHLLHEDTYRYFREAHRSLKPGGLMVFSFLEFRIPCHWDVFISSVDGGASGKHLDQFIDRNGIQAWAEHSGFIVREISDGDKPHFPIPTEVIWDNGMRMAEAGNFGQSVAVLEKKA